MVIAQDIPYQQLLNPIKQRTMIECPGPTPATQDLQIQMKELAYYQLICGSMPPLE